MKNKQKKQIGAIKSLKHSIKKDELKQIEGIFPQNLMNDLIHDKLKETVIFQHIIKTDNLSYKAKNRKNYNFSEYSLSTAFLRNIHGGHLTLEDAGDKQNNFAAKLKNLR